MNARHAINGHDAIRLLSNAIQMVHTFDKTGEGFSPCCRDPGELILQAALEYLAWGDTHNARKLMDIYDEWARTGFAPWPYARTLDLDDGIPF